MRERERGEKEGQCQLPSTIPTHTHRLVLHLGMVDANTHTHTHFHSPSNTSLNRHILSLGTPFGLCTGQAAILCQEMHTKQLRHTLSHDDKLHSTLQAAALHHWCNLIGSNSLRPHIICQKSPDPNLPPCCCDSH